MGKSFRNLEKLFLDRTFPLMKPAKSRKARVFPLSVGVERLKGAEVVSHDHTYVNTHELDSTFQYGDALDVDQPLGSFLSLSLGEDFDFNIDSNPVKETEDSKDSPEVTVDAEMSANTAAAVDEVEVEMRNVHPYSELN